ncbi:MAG TPA: TonB-dependent receptor [Moraxellaceae bacterium]|nr:TonB-dependent receptor [Moraxellaceae bacterium]
MANLTAVSTSLQAADDEPLLDLPLESLLQVQVSVAAPFHETVREAAASVAVLQPQDWQRRGATSVPEALEQVPSVATYPSLGGATAIAVRGYATELSTRGIATLLDDIPVDSYSYSTAAYQLPFVPLGVLSRVEMVRGPGSTLYGSDAFHGVVAMDTWMPADGMSTFNLGSGRNGDSVFSALASTPAGRDPAVRSASGVTLTYRGDRELPFRVTDPETGAERQGSFADGRQDQSGFLHLETGSADDPQGLWRLSLYGDNFHSKNTPGIGRQFYEGAERQLQVASVSFNGNRDFSSEDAQFAQAQLMFQRPLGDRLQFEMRAFRWLADWHWTFDFSQNPDSVTTLTNVVLPCRTSPTQTGVSPFYCSNITTQGIDEQRTGVHFLLRPQDTNGRTVWALGAGHDREYISDATFQRVGTNGQVYADITPPIAGVGRNIDYLLFQSRTELVPDRLSAVYGLREDFYSDVGNAASPRLGLVYQVSPEWTGKLQYSHAFRAPSAVEQFGNGAASQQLANPDIKPETIDSTELVLQHASYHQDSEIVLFQSKWHNGIVLTPVAPPNNQYQNIGRSHSSGLEVSHRIRMATWMLEGNASYVHSRDDSHDVNYGAFPRYTVNLGVGRLFGPDREVWLNERILTDRTRGDALGALPPQDAPNYYRTDLHISWQVHPCRVWFDVRNVFDRHNIVPAVYNAEGGLEDDGMGLMLGVEWGWR